MHIIADQPACFGHGLGCKLRAVALEQDQLGAAGEEAGRSCLVDLDMSMLVAQNAAIWRAQSGEREAIGRGSRRRPESANLGPEQVGEGAVEPRAPLVSVIGCVEPVGGRSLYVHAPRGRAGRAIDTATERFVDETRMGATP